MLFHAALHGARVQASHFGCRPSALSCAHRRAMPRTTFHAHRPFSLFKSCCPMQSSTPVADKSKRCRETCCSERCGSAVQGCPTDGHACVAALVAPVPHAHVAVTALHPRARRGIAHREVALRCRRQDRLLNAVGLAGPAGVRVSDAALAGAAFCHHAGRHKAGNRVAGRLANRSPLCRRRRRDFALRSGPCGAHLTHICRWQGSRL